MGFLSDQIIFDCSFVHFSTVKFGCNKTWRFLSFNFKIEIYSFVLGFRSRVRVCILLPRDLRCNLLSSFFLLIHQLWTRVVSQHIAILRLCQVWFWDFWLFFLFWKFFFQYLAKSCSNMWNWFFLNVVLFSISNRSTFIVVSICFSKTPMLVSVRGRQTLILMRFPIWILFFFRLYSRLYISSAKWSPIFQGSRVGLGHG